MLLADSEIRRRLEAGSLRIEPAPEDADIQPASIDLRLGGSFKLFRRGTEVTRVLDCAEPCFDEAFSAVVDGFLDGCKFMLEPGDFVLGVTREIVHIPKDLAARIEGKSSVARCGVVVHTTAGFIDPGFSGQVTLEICNLNTCPVRLTGGQRIAQISFTSLQGAVLRPYGSAGLRSKYQGQTGATPARGTL